MEGREQSRERKAERKEGRSKLMKNKIIKKMWINVLTKVRIFPPQCT